MISNDAKITCKSVAPLIWKATDWGQKYTAKPEHVSKADNQSDKETQRKDSIPPLSVSLALLSMHFANLIQYLLFLLQYQIAWCTQQS